MTVKVLDANGRELEKGGSVRLAGSGHMPPSPVQDAGKVTRTITNPGAAIEGVEVEWPDADTTCFDWYPLDAEGRCPDLELIDPKQEAPK